MPPEKSVSAHKDTFFECQKMTIAEIFVKKRKKRFFGKNAWIGIECAAPRKREAQFYFRFAFQTCRIRGENIRFLRMY